MTCFGYIMSKNKTNLVVKTHWLNTALQTLSKTEIRIIQLAIVDARETGSGLDTVTPLRLDATRYSELFGGTRQTAYDNMKRAEETLFNRRFTFINEHGRPVKSRWLQQVEYKDGEGAIELVFTVAVVKGISRIDGLEEFFTSYLLEQTVGLSSVYSIRLYELLTQWRTAKKTPVFELEKFRAQMGVGVNEYEKMNDFKKRVLDLAINEINDKTDLKVSYTQEKKGVRISGFKFTVNEKPKPKKEQSDIKSDNGDLFTIEGMSDKQLARIARSPQFKADYNHLISPSSSINNDYTGQAWVNHFVAELKRNPLKFSKRPIKDYLDY